MLADCDRCALRDIACAECVITVLPDGQAGLGDEERRALRALAAAGLVPPLRFRPAPGTMARATAAPATTARATAAPATMARATAAQATTAPSTQAPATQAPATQALEFAPPACSTGPSGPVTGARPGLRRPAARRGTGRPGRPPVPSHW